MKYLGLPVLVCLSLFFCFSHAQNIPLKSKDFGVASRPSEEEIDSLALRYIPDEFEKNIIEGKPATIGLGVGYKHVVMKVKGEKNTNLVLMYYDLKYKCELRHLVKTEKKWVLQGPAVLQYADQIDYCREIEAKDLDQDGQDEILIVGGENRETLPPEIFFLKEGKLVNVSPLQSGVGGSKISAFPNALVVDKPVLGKLLIFDFEEETYKGRCRIYELRDGNIVLRGAFDFISYVGTGKEFTVLKPTTLGAGEYKLNIKNVSDHSRTVRAEIVINGDVTLMPKDFCDGPEPKRTHKEKWSGNDDSDDLDEDGHKRCAQKKEVYAIVNLKKENEIKVKVFGKKDSKIELSLLKK